MQITVRLLASYRRYLPKDHDIQAGYVHDVPLGYQAGDRLTGLRIPAKDAWAIQIDGSHAQQDHVLHEAGILAFFPAVGVNLLN